MLKKYHFSKLSFLQIMIYHVNKLSQFRIICLLKLHFQNLIKNFSSLFFLFFNSIKYLWCQILIYKYQRTVDILKISQTISECSEKCSKSYYLLQLFILFQVNAILIKVFIKFI